MVDYLQSPSKLQIWVELTNEYDNEEKYPANNLGFTTTLSPVRSQSKVEKQERKILFWLTDFIRSPDKHWNDKVGVVRFSPEIRKANVYIGLSQGWRFPCFCELIGADSGYCFTIVRHSGPSLEYHISGSLSLCLSLTRYPGCGWIRISLDWGHCIGNIRISPPPHHTPHHTPPHTTHHTTHHTTPHTTHHTTHHTPHHTTHHSVLNCMFRSMSCRRA